MSTSSARSSSTLVSVGNGEIWRVSTAFVVACKPVLHADIFLLILRQIESAAAVSLLARVNAEFAAAAAAWFAEARVLRLESVECEDERLLHIVRRTRSLTSLDARGCKAATSEGLLAAISMATHLQRLVLADTAIDACGLAALWCALPSLSALDVNGCTGLGGLARHLGACFPPPGALQSLSLARCEELSGRADVLMLCRLCGPSLIALDASGYDDLESSTLQAITEHCPALRCVRLAESDRLDEEAIEALATQCRALVLLDLSWCAGLSAPCLVHLILRCPSLEHLELRCCPAVDAAVLMSALGGSCPSLRVLNLNRCANEVLDYYGTAFESNAVREGGFHRPFVSVRCALTEPSLHHGHQKHGCESWAQEHPRGWVKSWESARSGFVDID